MDVFGSSYKRSTTAGLNLDERQELCTLKNPRRVLAVTHHPLSRRLFDTGVLGYIVAIYRSILYSILGLYKGIAPIRTSEYMGPSSLESLKLQGSEGCLVKR